MASQSHTKKCLAYNVSFKLEVVSYAKIHGNRAAFGKFTLSEINVRNRKAESCPKRYEQNEERTMRETSPVLRDGKKSL